MRISRSLGMAMSGAMLAMAAGYSLLHVGVPQEEPPGHALHAVIAAQPGNAALLSPTAAQAARSIRIAVAAGNDASPPVYRFRKNDSVDFRVLVPYDGMLAVHGYTSDVPVTANRELTLQMKLEHTGRFPMHVHVNGGQHIEVAVLEILPD